MITLQRGRYEALELIGSGTTSRVEKARDNVIGRTVALKTFIDCFAQDQEQQFLQEARLVGQLSHPAVVQLFDVGIDEDGTPFLVMEYIAGKTLEHYFASSTLTVQRACAWMVDLAGALAAAHRAGMIHGDVKPGNILITPDKKVKLGDFGIARLATQASRDGRLLGTPAYLAPEQIQSETQDQRSDQFSLGIVFYQMLTGVPPFDGSSLGTVCSQIVNFEPARPSRLNPAVPLALDDIVTRCLAKNPQDRFESCEEFARALYPFARSRPQPAAPASEKTASALPAASLQIEITSSVTEGTLAVFADQDLVCVANLSAYKPGSPIHLERTLSAGPHRLRVAYYKPDRSLLSEKEGLGDVFASGENKLAVCMSRGARLLFRNELLLNVAWPGAQTSPAEQHCAALMTPALTQ
jgi:eukaryotic-like serine/threonine-protein kinase